jgi:DNA-binding SARP family transcriptional activator
MSTDLVNSLIANHEGCHAPVLRLFGGPVVTCDGLRYEVPQGSMRLLVFVALHCKRVERRYAAGLLWPEGTEYRAAGNLRSALWRLNHAHIDVLKADRHSILLREGVLTDVHIVMSWATRVIAGECHAGDLDVLPSGLDATELLPGWYEDWVLMERERVRQRMLHAMEALSRTLVRSGRCADAVEAAMIAVNAEPLRESAQQALLEAHLAEGNWIEGRRGYEAYRNLLAAELQTEPDPILKRLLYQRASAMQPPSQLLRTQPSSAGTSNRELLTSPYGREIAHDPNPRSHQA